MQFDVMRIGVIFIELIAFVNGIEPQVDFNEGSMRKLTEYLIEEKVGHGLSHKFTMTIGGQKVKAKISTSFCGYWILNSTLSNKKYDHELSLTYEKSSVNDQLEFVSGRVGYETVEMDGFTTKNFPFLLVDTINTNDFDYNSYSTAGFGFFCDNTIANVDVLQQLAKHNNGLSQVMSFILFQDLTGTINIGAYPSDFSSDPKYYRTVKVAKEHTQQQWSFTLHSVFFDDNEIMKINDYFSIGTGGHVFSVKKPFFEYFAKKFFDPLFELGTCFWNKDGVYEIICEKNATMPRIGVISLVVGKWNLKINGDDLFTVVGKKKRKKKHFAMIYYPMHNQYYISQCFVPDVYVVYDKIKEEVGIFKQKRFINKKP